MNLRTRSALLLCVTTLAGCPGRSIIPTDAGADLGVDRADATSTDAADVIDATITPDVIDSTPLDANDALDAPDVLDATSIDGDDASVIDALDAGTVDDSSSDGAIESGVVWTPIGDGGCNARVRATPLQPAIHVDPDAGPITWLTNPPSSGPHYPIWAHWGTFPEIPPGYWVHNLEHGGVAILYSCPLGSCTATADALTAAVDTIPTDPACMPDDASPARVRVVVTHYDPLDTPIAAAAWGWLYAADCVDPATLRQFYAEHAGMAPEDFCADGYYP